MNKIRKKYIVICLIFFAIILISVIIAFLIRPNGKDLVTDFEKAILTNDTNTLSILIEPSNKDMDITKKDIEDLMFYAKNHSNYLQELILILQDEVKLQSEFFEKSNKYDVKTAGDFYIKKDKGFFGDYKIYARPYKLKLSANKPDTVIELNGKEVFKTENEQLEKTIPLLAPGKYTVRGTKNYDFASIETYDEVNLFDNKEHQVSIELDVEGKKIDVEASIENVEIVVNDIKTGKKAGVIDVSDDGTLRSSEINEEGDFGPVLTDGSVKVHGEIEYPWGIAKSIKHTITEDTNSLDLTPIPFGEQDIRDQFVKVINDFSRQRVQALVKKKAALINTASDNIIKEYTEKIQSAKTKDSYWKGTAIGTRIDLGNIKFTQNNEQYEVEIPVEFHNKIKKFYVINSNEPIKEMFEVYWLILTYNEKSQRWIVEELRDYNVLNKEFMVGNEVVKSEFK